MRPDPTGAAAAPANELGLSFVGRVYVGVVGAVGIAVVGWSAVELASATVPGLTIVLTALTLLGGVLAIGIPAGQARLSVFDGLLFAIILLAGAAPAVVVVAVDGVLTSVRSRRPTVYRCVFNAAEPAVSVWCATVVFTALSGSTLPLGDERAVEVIGLPLVGLAATYFALNAVFMAVAMGLETGERAVTFLRRHLPHLVLNLVLNLGLLASLSRPTPDVPLPRGSTMAVALTFVALSYVVSRWLVTRMNESIP